MVEHVSFRVLYKGLLLNPKGFVSVGLLVRTGARALLNGARCSPIIPPCKSPL